MCCLIGLRVGRSAIHSSILTLGAITGAVVFGTHPLLAEIVIDEFDDSIQIQLPQQEDEWFYTDHVGDFEAFRSARIRASRTEPNGKLDISISTPSVLTVVIPDSRHTEVEPTLAVNLIYDLDTSDGVDLSQGGTNKAIVLDFHYLTAVIPLRRLQVSVSQPVVVDSIRNITTYASSVAPAIQNAQPFCLVLPFDSFRLDRGPPVLNFDFSAVLRLDLLLTVGLTDENLPELLNFRMALDRIRVSQIVPEPSTSFCVLPALMLMIGLGRLHRFKFCTKEGRHVEIRNFAHRVLGNCYGNAS